VYRLETFGGLNLAGEGLRSVSHQRRRLALLALLAASGDRGMSREQIVPYLWPESDGEAARHALEQLVHAIRRSLGDDVFAGVNPLALSPLALTSDVADFLDALSRGDLADAVALYRGPFINGFYLEAAPEFERWTETERARLASRYADALRRLGDDAEKAGDVSACAAWRKRLVETDPLSSRHALAYMRALAAAGDRAAALQHARVHEALVRQELESDPDPSIAAEVARLRTNDGRVAAVVPTASVVDVRAPRPVEAPTNVDPTPPIAASAKPETGLPETQTGMRRTWTSGRWWSLAGILVVAALFIVAWSVASRRTSQPLAPNRFVVLPFSITGGDSSVAWMRVGVVDRLSPMLTGEGGPLGVDSRTSVRAWHRRTGGRDATADDARDIARDVGAGKALFGTLVFASGRITLTSNVVDADRGTMVPLTSASATPDSLQALLEGVLRQILIRQAEIPDPTARSLSTTPLPVLRAYLDGQSAYRRAHSAEAIQDFLHALDADSTFALAAVDLALATTKVLRQGRVCLNNKCHWASVVPGFRDSGPESDDAQFERAIRLAWENRASLAPRDLALLEALRGAHWPVARSAREMVGDFERAVAAAPDRADTQYLLGLLLLYQGTTIGRTDAFAQAAARFRTALELDSVYIAPLARLVDVGAYQRDTASVRRYGAMYLARDSVGAIADFVRWRVAVGTNDASTLRQIRARFKSLDLATLTQIVTASQMTGDALEDADRASTLIIDRTTHPIDHTSALYWGHMLALNRGRPHLADSLMRLRHEIDTSPYFFRAVTTWAVLYGEGDRADADTTERARAEFLARDTLTEPSHRPDSTADQASREHYQDVLDGVNQEALWRWAHASPKTAVDLARWMRRHDDANRADIVDMLLASDAGSPDAPSLRTRVAGAALDGCCNGNHHVYLLLATAYERAGQYAEALQAVRRGQWRLPTMFLAAYLGMEGRLAERVGDHAGAIRAYEHYLALRSDPEPGHRAGRDSVRAELSRIERATTTATHQP